MPPPSRRPRRSPQGSPLEAIVARADAAAGGAPSPDTVPSGFASLDELLGGGLRRQDLVLLTGDVGSGKSALALAIALRAARRGLAVVYLSGEMSEERLWERALAAEGRAAVDDLRRGTLDEPARAAVAGAAVTLRGLPLVFRRLPGERFEEVTGAVPRLPRPELVVVDSVRQVAPPHPASRVEERTAAAVRALKGWALREDLAVLAVVPLAREVAARPDPRPTLDDLGARGSPKQHADVVLSIYREEMYRPGGGIEGATELIVSKNRNGPTGFVDLYFYRRWLRFEDLAEGA